MKTHHSRTVNGALANRPAGIIHVEPALLLTSTNAIAAVAKVVKSGFQMADVLSIN
jgi:hypothetical protein